MVRVLRVYWRTWVYYRGRVPTRYSCIRIPRQCQVSHHLRSLAHIHAYAYTPQEIVSLWENKLSGSVPTQVGYLTHMTRLLELGTNQLTSTVPTELGLLTGMTRYETHVHWPYQKVTASPNHANPGRRWLTLDQNSLSGS